MSKKAFALRIDAQILDAIQRWADDDLRSLNAQIEWALRDALRRAGRMKTPTDEPAAIDAPNPERTASDKLE